jgi:6-phosphofructokinase 1
VQLLEQGKGNMVVGLKKNTVIEHEINEALEMKKVFDEELHTIADIISF